MRIRSFILAASLSSALIVSSADASRRSQLPLDCGSAVAGLQICLTSTGSNLQLALRNVGDRDVILNLGVMLGNGKTQLPNNISLNFTDARGKTRLFKFADKRYSFVAGRMDDYVVPLRAGSTYTLQLTFDQFWCSETKEFSIPLEPGKNLLTAQYEGSGAKTANLDMSAIKFMNFWLGKVESNILTLER
jgi:hypothetical protein